MKKQKKREHLLDLAIDVLNRNGIKKTTLDDIAEAAGVATPSLFYYFKNKKQMLKGAFAKVFETGTKNLARDISSCKTPESKLRAIPQSLRDTVQNAKFIASVDLRLKPEMVMLAQDLIDSFTGLLTENISSILQDGCEKGLFEVRDISSVSEIMALTIWNLLEKDIATPEFETFDYRANTLLSLLIEGLKKR